MIEALLANKEYQKVIDLLGSDLNEASQMIRIGCLYHLNQLELAKEEAQALFKVTAHYEDVLVLYLNILMKKGDFNEARQIVEAELEAPYVPKETLNALESIKQELNIEDKKEGLLKLRSIDTIEALLKGDYMHQLEALQYMYMINPQPYVESLLAYLKGEAGDQTLKTAFIVYLAGFIKDTIEVKKFNQTYIIDLSTVQAIEEMPMFQSIDRYLEKYVDSNPSLKLLVQQYLQQLFEYWYPVEIEENIKLLVAASVVIVETMQLGVSRESYWQKQFNVSKEELEKVIDKIKFD